MGRLALINKKQQCTNILLQDQLFLLKGSIARFIHKMIIHILFFYGIMGY